MSTQMDVKEIRAFLERTGTRKTRSLAVVKRLMASESAAARWIGRDALKELSR